jgi:hypothetical protein
MIKDPFTRWPDGVFPYDALASVDVTPQSSLREVRDASFELMARGLMTPEVRAAWDSLRDCQRRLFVDFFLYQLDPDAEANLCRQALTGYLANGPVEPDVAGLFASDPTDLRAMGQEFGPLRARRVRLTPLTGFDGDLDLPVEDLTPFDR